MRIGIDIVKIARVKDLLKDTEKAASIFSAEELSESIETMAGKFAAKEAYFKALGEKRDWKSVLVAKHDTGAPYLICPEGERAKVSISHDGEYAIAIVLIE